MRRKLDHLVSALDLALGFDVKLTVVHLRVLLLIAQRGSLGTSQEDVQKILRVSQATASRTLARLSLEGSPSPSVGWPLGLVELQPTHNDARVRLAYLSFRGKSFVDSL